MKHSAIWIRSLSMAVARRIVALSWLVPASVLSFAYVADGEAQLAERAARRFLMPSDESVFLPADHPRVQAACRGNDSVTACPKFLKYGNDAAGPGPFLPPILKADVPHLLVTFTLHDIEHVLIAGEGVASALVDAQFMLDSSASNAESPQIYSGHAMANFLPGTTRSSNAIMWQAIVYGGCIAPPPVMPLSFRNEISTSSSPNGVILTPDGEGVFDAVDKTSLVPTGFWNVRYTVRVSNRDGDASDFKVRGNISLVCVGSDSTFP